MPKNGEKAVMKKLAYNTYISKSTFYRNILSSTAYKTTELLICEKRTDNRQTNEHFHRPIDPYLPERSNYVFDSIKLLFAVIRVF